MNPSSSAPVLGIKQVASESRDLIVLCGVPGSGKSTLASHLVRRWNAVSFASEMFAEELGPAGRTSAGDLTPQAIEHAYSAMAAAVRAALATSKLVVTVGSFRSQQQRERFRSIATDIGARVTVLRISCPADLAAERVRLRLAQGERGPDEDAIRLIEAQLDRAEGLDGCLTNDASLESFLFRADCLVKSLTDPCSTGSRIADGGASRAPQRPSSGGP